MSIPIRLAAIGLSLLAASGQPPPQASPPKPAKISIRALEVRGPPEPQPQPSDKFEVDHEAGEIRIQSTDREGTLRNFQVLLPVHIKPVIAGQAVVTSTGAVLYSYSLTNAPGARQRIRLFAVGMEHPETVSAPTAPKLWMPRGASTGAVPRYNWYTENVLEDSLAAGASASPFSFLSRDLPGLTKAYLLSDGEIIKSPGFYSASPWIIKKFNEATMGENYFVRVPVIGPKIPAGLSRDQLLDAIQEEIRAAAGMPEFAAIQRDLLAYAGKLGSPGAGAPPEGKSQIQRDFLAAMALNLAVLSPAR